MFNFHKSILSYSNNFEHIYYIHEHIYYLSVYVLKFCNIEYEVHFKST